MAHAVVGLTLLTAHLWTARTAHDLAGVVLILFGSILAVTVVAVLAKTKGRALIGKVVFFAAFIGPLAVLSLLTVLTAFTGASWNPAFWLGRAMARGLFYGVGMAALRYALLGGAFWK